MWIYLCLDFWLFSVRPQCIQYAQYTIYAIWIQYLCGVYSRYSVYSMERRMTFCSEGTELQREWKSLLCSTVLSAQGLQGAKKWRWAREMKRPGLGGRMQLLGTWSWPQSEALLKTVKHWHTYVQFTLNPSQTSRGCERVDSKQRRLRWREAVESVCWTNPLEALIQQEGGGRTTSKELIGTRLGLPGDDRRSEILARM